MPRASAMCTAIALVSSEQPVILTAAHGLADQIHDRGGEREVRFHWRTRPTVLPAWWDGRLQVVRRGNRDRAERRLPPTGKTWRATVEAGRWAEAGAEAADVPATYAFMNGVWYRVRQGLRGLLVRTAAGNPVVHLICEPATQYDRVMTRAEWMPVLIGEVI